MKLNPKEKADELIGKMFSFIPVLESVELMKIPAKFCAIMAVKEIIDAIGWHELEVPNDEYEYWNNVLSELRNP